MPNDPHKVNHEDDVPAEGIETSPLLDPLHPDNGFKPIVLPTQSSSHNDPSLFWTEKGLVLFHFLQLYALIWQAGQPWGAPYLWSYYTRWLHWINIDYFSTTAQGALVGATADLHAAKWGQMKGYLIYAIAFAAAPYIILLVAYSTSLYALHAPGSDRPRQHHRIVSFMQLFIQLVYLPVSLAVFRLFYCENGLLDCDRSISCSSSLYITTTTGCSLLLAPLFFGTPYYLTRCIDATIIYRQSRDHEKRLQATEISYMLGLDNVWLSSHMWLASSFHRRRAHTPIAVLALKGTLLILFVFARRVYWIQAGLMWVSVSLAAVYCGIKWPYRIRSSNHTLFTAVSLLLILTSYHTMNAFGASNFFTVSSRQFYGMLSFFGGGIITVGAIATDCLLHSQYHRWPAAHTLTNLITSSESSARVSKWIEALKTGRAVCIASFMAPDATVDISSIERACRRLRRCWLAARSRGSIFEIIIGDALDQLLHIHSKRYPLALRKHVHWDERASDLCGAVTRRRQQAWGDSDWSSRVGLKAMAVSAFRGLGTDAAKEYSFADVEEMSDVRGYESDVEELVRTDRVSRKYRNGDDIAV